MTLHIHIGTHTHTRVFCSTYSRWQHLFADFLSRETQKHTDLMKFVILDAPEASNTRLAENQSRTFHRAVFTHQRWNLMKCREPGEELKSPGVQWICENKRINLTIFTTRPTNSCSVSTLCTNWSHEFRKCQTFQGSVHQRTVKFLTTS